jgi:hypothetical protein
MIVIGVVLGLFTFFIVSAVIGDGVLHHADAGAFQGAVAAIWAAWPFFHNASVKRSNFLHPVPKEYKISAKAAFVAVCDFLTEVAYNFGDRWHILAADTQTGRIVAHLRFTDEELRFEPDSRGHIHTRKERLQRFVGLEILVKPGVGDTAIVQCDYTPKVEGGKFFACDSIITGVNRTLELNLGPGSLAGVSAETKLPAPPWWLLGISVLALLVLFTDVGKGMVQ